MTIKTPIPILAALLAILAISAAPALAAAPEAPVTEAPTANTTGTTATFNGELNPGLASENVAYHFAYSASAGCTDSGFTAPGEPFPEATGNHTKVTQAVAGLEGSTEYTVCLIAANPAEPAASTQGTSVKFNTPAAKPVIASETAPTVTPFDATLEARVNPENQATKYHFEYSSVEAKLGTPEATSFGEGSFPGVGEELTAGPADIGGGLVPETTYYFRVVATNGTGVTGGKVESFKTATAAPPVIEGESVSGVSATGVTLEAIINPNYQESTCKFEYGTEPLLATGVSTESCLQALGNGGMSPSLCPEGEGFRVGICLPVAGLQPRTTYYYRAAAENASGAPPAATIEHFTTLATPLLSTGETQNLTRTSATLTGSVNPGGAETTYRFAYIEQEAYEEALADGATNPYATGASTPETSAGSDYTAHAVSAALSNLRAGVTYDYELIATNSVGTEIVSKDTFTTSSKTPPILGEVSVSEVTQGAATITGTLNGEGLPTRWEIQLGQTPGELQQAASDNNGGALIGVTLHAASLSAGTTYYYKLVAVNPDGTVETPEAAFTTVAAPVIAPQLSTPLLALPDIAFPSEEKVTPGGRGSHPKKTAKCPKGKKRNKHGKCTKVKTKKETKGKKRVSSVRRGRK